MNLAGVLSRLIRLKTLTTGIARDYVPEFSFLHLLYNSGDYLPLIRQIKKTLQQLNNVVFLYCFEFEIGI